MTSFNWDELDGTSQRLLLALDNPGGEPYPVKIKDLPEELRDPDVLRLNEARDLVTLDEAYGESYAKLKWGTSLELIAAGLAAKDREELLKIKGSPDVSPDPADGVSPKGASPWRTHQDGVQLRGWKAILSTIEACGNKRSHESMKRLNEQTDGPITWCGRKPEVDRGELLAWLRDAEGREEKAEARRVSARAAGFELAERNGLRAQDSGAHIESRPNARGKAREADPGSS